MNDICILGKYVLWENLNMELIITTQISDFLTNTIAYLTFASLFNLAVKCHVHGAYQNMLIPIRLLPHFYKILAVTTGGIVFIFRSRYYTIFWLRLWTDKNRKNMLNAVIGLHCQIDLWPFHPRYYYLIK